MNKILLYITLATQFFTTPSYASALNPIQKFQYDDSLTLIFKVTNPYNRQRVVPGVIVTMELDKWDPIHSLVTDINGIARMRIPKIRLHEKIKFYYIREFQTSIYLSELNILLDTVINVQLEYIDWSYLYSASSNKIPQTKTFCSNVDS